ncbi:GH12 family glycosyl hydrolase domain-containing protein [Micromonospora sp. LOL_021]|uniref:GH12 family glycosyl hydrolase domain-containing protein n=1 Tax=Micromonospora sp. LOL_021 TaxID=3345417 RepID=UPI003A8952AC
MIPLRLRRHRLPALVVAALVVAGVTVVWLAPDADASELCGRADTIDITDKRYVVMNNVWGADTPQCLTVDAAGRFEVTHTEHDKRDGSAAAYPTIYQGCHWGNCTVGSGLPIKVTQLRTARSNWAIDTQGATGRWNATYDLWFHTDANAHRSPDGAELMVWLDRAGGAEPAGTLVARGVALAGATWDVYYADWHWNYVAYVRTTPVDEARDLELAAFTRDAVGRGYLDRDWYLSGIEAGFEIWHGGAGLTSRSFQVAINL